MMNYFINIQSKPRSPKSATVKMDSKEVELRGGRFEDSVDAAEKHTESTFFDKYIDGHDIMRSLAIASTIARQELITEDGNDEIERGEFVGRNDGEDVHRNNEASHTDLVGEPAKKLHTVHSRNDQVFFDLCSDAIDKMKLITEDGNDEIERGEFVGMNDGEDVHMNNEAAHTDWVGEPAKKLHTARSRKDQASLRHTFLASFKLCAEYASRSCALAVASLLMTSEALGFIAPMRNRPNKGNDEGSNNPSNKGNDEGSGGAWNGIRIRTLVRVGLLIGGVVGLYRVYKTGQAMEREIVGALRDWKKAGFPALVKIENFTLRVCFWH